MLSLTAARRPASLESIPPMRHACSLQPTMLKSRALKWTIPTGDASQYSIGAEAALPLECDKSWVCMMASIRLLDGVFSRCFARGISMVGSSL